MVREFTCRQCGKKFNVEAEVFEPGVSGDIYTSDGKHLRYVDPTVKRSCSSCTAKWFNEEFLKQLAEFERGELE